MPMQMPFNLPSFYNRYNYSYNSLNKKKYNTINNKSELNKKQETKKDEEKSKLEDNSDFPNYLFEIFGLKLHLDDVLIICILFFLYSQDVHDEELFLCLILLLIS